MHEFFAHNFLTKYEVRSFLGETEFLNVLTSLLLSVTFFVSVRVWRYGSQLFHHYFYFDLPLHVFSFCKVNACKHTKLDFY